MKPRNVELFEQVDLFPDDTPSLSQIDQALAIITIRDLGMLTGADCGVACPLLKLDGCIPAPGHDWKHATTSYSLAPLGATPCQIVDAIVSKRKKAAAELGQFIMAQRPENTDLVVLAGWWMHETVINKGVFIDCTYAFIPRDKIDCDEPVIVEMKEAV